MAHGASAGTAQTLALELKTLLNGKNLDLTYLSDELAELLVRAGNGSTLVLARLKQWDAATWARFLDDLEHEAFKGKFQAAWVQAWDLIKELTPEVRLSSAEKIHHLLAGGRIPADKLETALNEHFIPILKGANETSAIKLLDRLGSNHVDEAHFDEILKRLNNYPTLKQDLIANPQWFEIFDDILKEPSKYWDILQEGGLPSNAALAQWGQGFWWKNLREFADEFESIAALDKIEVLFGTVYGTKISLKVTNKVTGDVIEIVPDFLALKNGKYHIADAKFTTKSNFSVEDTFTPNQGEVFAWIKNQVDIRVEVRAANSKLENIPGLSQGDIISGSDFKIDILKSKQNDHSIVETVINYY